MNLLLIFLCIAVLLSPLIWIKPSPRMKQIEAMRKLASVKGVRVRLHARPEALEDEKKLDHVCYFLPWLKKVGQRHWVLHRNSQRGWPSAWDGWLWRVNTAPESLEPIIANVIVNLPEDCLALISDEQGVGAIWTERSGEAGLSEIVNALTALREAQSANLS